MTYTDPIENPAGAIQTVMLGTGYSSLAIGGAKALPFHFFDGVMPNPPRIAMEVYDAEPSGWPASLTEAIGDVISDPVAWAKACVEQWGADMVCVQLASTDPNGANRTPEEAAQTVKEIASAVNVPLVVYGCGNAEKDAEVLKKVAEVVSDTVLAIGSASDENYKPITAAALGYGHVVVAETPIDVNMAKQLNILITQMGLPSNRVLIDPSVGAVGYGVEYAFTVMQRLRLAALNQNDAMTQMPMICNLGREAWRSKEARATAEEEPIWGDAEKRGVLWETSTAITFALSGADVLVMRHPKAVATVRTAINGMLDQ
ncbi:MAG: acetyl-CoA decarbonylase/synthase complex subunit delta [Actinobacteria bacterium HGW-Actinobacteria-7]|nr:MAG: acetyl-CoA decarbonylase/synthase complex subunit delta [Actinobacteria bacterium HGW-Actinobacteria-7]